MDEPGEPLTAIRRFYEAEARYSATGSATDRTELLATLHVDIVLHQPRSLPYGGEWRGRQAFGCWLDRFMHAWTDVRPVDPVLRVCGEDTIVSTVTMRALARATGKRIEMPMCQIIRIADGTPVEWRNFAWDTAEMVGALKGTAVAKP